MPKVKQALSRMQANEIPNNSPVTVCFELRHELLGGITLQIDLLSNLDGVSVHLRQFPVDLLIYDERGEDAKPAPEAIRHIRKDVRSLADLWGPDFLFPMSRVVAVLREQARHAERAFELGRQHVRDVCIAPKSIATLLLWLKHVLTHGIIRQNRVGIALAGGGVEGLLYQLGVLYALDLVLVNRRLSEANVIAGVSSGSIAGALYAAKIPVEEAIKAFHQRSKLLPPLTSQTIFDLAGGNIARRVVKESIRSLGSVSLNPQDWFNKTLRSIPTGFLRGNNIEAYLHKVLTDAGLNDRFEDFETDLYIGATDQDSFDHIIFGQSPWDKVKVSEAIRASCALPPIYLPKHINGRWFIDGQVTKTTDLELVIERGCSLVVIINPLKPHANMVPGTTDQQGGVYGIIQTIKALVSSRFQSSLRHITERYPDVDFIVFEPDEDCATLMAGSPMRYRIRTEIIQLAYGSTLRRLRERHAVYESKFAKYDFKLCSIDDIRELEKLDVNTLGLDEVEALSQSETPVEEIAEP